MTTKTIGELPTAPVIPGTTMFEVEIDGVSRRLTLDQIKGALLSGYVPTATDPAVVEAVRQAAEEIDLIKQSIGDAVSAAESAKQAEEIRKLTVLARGVAETAANAAQDAQQQTESVIGEAQEALNAAQGAQQGADAAALAAAKSASDASGFATTASDAVTIATQRADEAGQAATIASAQSTIAQTKAGEASVKASEAATSASDAQGFRNQASTFSEVAASSYQRTINLVGNPSFDNGTDGWLELGGGAVRAEYAGRKNVFVTPPGVGVNGLQGQRVSINSANQRFRIAASTFAHALEGVTPQQVLFFVGAIFFDAEDRRVTATDGIGNYPLGSGYYLLHGVHGWLDREVIIGKGAVPQSPHGGTAQIPDGARYFRPIVYLNYYGMAGHEAALDYFTVQDVTSEVEAADFASAAATSAQTASTKATDAGISASAASTSATAASTKAGEASTSAGQASSSAADAQGFRNQASEFSRVAASTAADAAGAAASGGRDPGASPSLWAADLYNTLVVDRSNLLSYSGISIVDGKLQVTGGHHVHPRAAQSLVKGRRYQISATFRRVQDGPEQNQYVLYSTFWDVSGQLLYGNTVAMQTLVSLSASTGVVTISAEFVADADNSGAVVARPMFRFPEGGTTELVDLGIRDIQEASSAATSAQTASTKATEAGTSATAANQSKLEAQAAERNAATSSGASQSAAATATDKAAAATQQAELAARYRGDAESFAGAASGSAAAASASAASASRSAELAVSIGASKGGALNPNPEFSAWSNPDTTPDGWAYWNLVDKVTRVTNPFNRGGYAVKQTPTNSNSGIVNNDIFVPSGRCFMEVTAYKASGSWRGAGVTLSGVVSIDFATTPDISGAVGEVGDILRTWSVPFVAKDGTGITPGYKNWHCMSNWDGFNAGFNAKEIWWLDARVRPASSAESDVPAISARVKTTEDAIADLPNRFASADRTAVLESQVNFATDSGLQRAINARIEDRATAISNAAAGAVAQTVTNLRADYNGTAATVSEQAGAIVDLKGRTGAYWGVTVDDGQGPVEITAFAGAGARGVRIGGNLYVSGNVLVDGTVISSKIANGSVTNSITTTGGVFGLPQGQSKVTGDLNIAVSGTGFVRVDVRLSTNYGLEESAGKNQYGMAVYREHQSGNRLVGYTEFLEGPYISFWAIDAPPAGTARYYVQVTCNYANRSAVVSNTIINATEYKK